MYSQLTHLLSVLRAGYNEYQCKNIVLQFKAHEGAQDVGAFFAALKVIEMEGSPPFTESQHISNKERREQQSTI